MTYSDFEDTDIAYASDAPPPATRTDYELNLTVLQRYNPSILHLFHISPYAVVYTFSPDTSAWEKCGIEGSSFLVELAPNATHAERFAIMVLNRRGLENFFVELTSTEEVELADEYIILQGQLNGEDCVFGLWIFQEPPPASTAHEREEMARKIVECAGRVEAKRRRSPNAEDTGYEGEEEGDGSVELDAEEQMHGQATRGRGDLASILGQQRMADDSWSVRSHSPRRPQQQPRAQQTPELQQPGAPPAQFLRSADTDFFLAPKPKATTPSPAISAQSVQETVPNNTLLDLFRKAGNEYANNK
jgi:hypothetical protein